MCSPALGVEAGAEWRRRESKPSLEASGKNAPAQLKVVSVGVPAGYAASCPTPGCVESALARTEAEAGGGEPGLCRDDGGA